MGDLLIGLIDHGREASHPYDRQQSTAEEFGHHKGMAGAEGATAPETLRQMDRDPMTLWKVVMQSCASPTDDEKVPIAV